MTTTHLVQLVALLAILAAVVVPVLVGPFLAEGDPVGDGGSDAAMAEAREMEGRP